jgi:Flp pilus assembly pilin Flp
VTSTLAGRSHKNLLEERKPSHRFAKDDSVVTTIHYGLIVAGSTIAVIAVMNDPGTQRDTTFNSISSGLEGQ